MIEIVKAEHVNGCIPASIATILGWKYQDVVKHFHNDFNVNGVTHDQAVDFITDHGYSAIKKSVEVYTDIRQLRYEMMRPFAEIHLVSVKPYHDSEGGHALVMLDNGDCLDPHEEPWNIHQFYYIRAVTGFWKVGT